MKFVEISNTLGGMNGELTLWLEKQLSERGWSQSEAARRGGISSQMVNAVLNRQANAGLDFCRGVSRAFGIPMEDVLRLAGILPAKPVAPATIRQRRIVYEVNGLERLAELWRGLAVEDQGRLLDLMERLQAPVEPRIIGVEATDASG